MSPESHLQKLLKLLVPLASEYLGKKYNRPAPPWIQALSEALLDPDVPVGEDLRAYGRAFSGEARDAEGHDFVEETHAALAFLASVQGPGVVDGVALRHLSPSAIESLRSSARWEEKRIADERVKAEKERAKAEVLAEHQGELLKVLEERYRPRIEGDLRSALRAILEPQVREELRARLVEPVRETLNEELTRELEGVVQKSARMRRLARDLVKSGIGRDIAAKALKAAPAEEEEDRE